MKVVGVDCSDLFGLFGRWIGVARVLCGCHHRRGD